MNEYELACIDRPYVRASPVPQSYIELGNSRQNMLDDKTRFGIHSKQPTSLLCSACYCLKNYSEFRRPLLSDGYGTMSQTFLLTLMYIRASLFLFRHDGRTKYAIQNGYTRQTEHS